MKVIKENQVTDEKDYLNRRQFIKKSVQTGAGLWAAAHLPNAAAKEAADGDFDNIVKTPYGKELEPHTYEQITRYNNFYEFGTDKDDPAKYAQRFKTKPWHIQVSGACSHTGEFALEDLIKPYQLEERIYRFRCVEAWSMVVPWLGVPLNKMLSLFKPTSQAKFVVFKTLYDPVQMPGQRTSILDWPYIEGLTIAEAMNPLTLMAVGLYGKVLPNQNGAPFRLIVPWKYGFKSIKSIVSIHFQSTQPVNSWQQQAPNEYGFYANVNPNVDHPRWSQRRERVVGRGSFFSPEKRDTELFNGYQEEVAHLYTHLDLTQHF